LAEVSPTVASGRVSSEVEDARPSIALQWRRFAGEAEARSPAYVEVCHAVAASPSVLDFLAAGAVQNPA
jgi:hypothetical protein